MTDPSYSYDENCRKCPRLFAFLNENKKEFPEYHARPVAAFGKLNPKLLIVGMHGANATGRPFTGDSAGIFLFETLHRFGFSNRRISSHQDDGLELINCRITNAVKCLPPGNKPTAFEINTCNDFLQQELQQISNPGIILCLGLIAHKAVVKAFGIKQTHVKFAHANVHKLNNDITLVDSYHCSRYNTQTNRLTETMFHDVFKLINKNIH